MAIIRLTTFNNHLYLPIESVIQNSVVIYVIFVLTIPNLIITLKQIPKINLPIILKKQLAIFIHGMIIPMLIGDFIQLNPFKIRTLGSLAHNYAAVSFTTILITIAIYFCARKIFGLRFLNINPQVQRPMNMNFINDFKRILQELSTVDSCGKLEHVVQSFFKDTFHIPITKTHLYFCKQETENSHNTEIIDNKKQEKYIKIDATSVLVESFLTAHKKTFFHMISQEKVLVYDEIEFTHFYDACDESAIILNFMSTINVDIFLPICDKDKLIAYIIVEKNSRPHSFYSNVEQDEFLVLSNYLKNIINLLQNKQIEVILAEDQLLRKELYKKHQEMNQYKESIRSFLHKSPSHHIGVIFYKNKLFNFGNQAAKELIKVDVNMYQGHPITIELKKLISHVETFKTPYSVIIKNTEQKALLLSGIPSIDSNMIIILASYPDVADTIKDSIHLLKDPTEWDYLLYLQTTESGKLINKLIPGDVGPMLLHFKINLLKAALSKKAVLLDMHYQDVMPIVELLHHITLKDTLHILDLDKHYQPHIIATNLFGMNPLFTTEETPTKSILEKLNKSGTLFIKNIHFLDAESQENLVYLIRYGQYRMMKSDIYVKTDVRIICFSDQNLPLLAQKGQFNKDLLEELYTTNITMPSLITLPDNEFLSLADGLSQEVLKPNDLQHMLKLTDKDKAALTMARPVSLQDLKHKIQHIIVKKSKKNIVYHDVKINAAYNTVDPDLVLAARLGKQALKDKKIMQLLWNKFKNQNKISEFLGVNRSSVNRRCKEYNLF